MDAIASLISARFCFAGLSDLESRISPSATAFKSAETLGFSPHKQPNSTDNCSREALCSGVRESVILSCFLVSIPNRE